jgi:hypothetical protein
MFGSVILEIALSLVFLYLLLALVCSAAREGLEAFMKMRAMTLEKALKELLGDPTGQGMVKKLYEHPLIDGLFQGKYEQEKGGRFWSNLPSYIPGDLFTQALIDVVQQAAQAPAVAPAPIPEVAPTPAARAEVSALSLKRLRDAVSALPTTDQVKRALLTLIDSADGDMNKARANIETWFNKSMDRVSGWYKRWSQAIIFALSFLLVGLLNADTISISNNLSSDPSLRQTWTTAAEEWVKQHPEDPNGGSMKQNLNELRNLAWPIGWDNNDPRRWPQNGMGWTLKVLGLLITTLAISLGAPFWFDVLNKFMLVRSAVKPAVKSPVGQSTD